MNKYALTRKNVNPILGSLILRAVVRRLKAHRVQLREGVLNVAEGMAKIVKAILGSIPHIAFFLIILILIVLWLVAEEKVLRLAVALYELTQWFKQWFK